MHKAEMAEKIETLEAELLDANRALDQARTQVTGQTAGLIKLQQQRTEAADDAVNTEAQRAVAAAQNIELQRQMAEQDS